MRPKIALGSGMVLLAVCLGAASDARAVLVEWRTAAQSSLGSGTGLIFDNDGTLNQATSSTELSSGGNLTQAYATLSPDGYVPTLKALATNAGIHTQAVAWGVQGYTNTSGSILDTSLVVNLTADVVGNNYLEARVYLFQDENFEFAIDSGTILFETSSMVWPGFEPYANNAGPDGFDILIPSSGPVDETRQFDFSIDPGDSFYVWARLLATADNVGEVDAFSTLTASFTNTVGLTPAAVAAPEPAAAPLALLGLAALLALRTKRRV